jgi:hypothetical protein
MDERLSTLLRVGCALLWLGSGAAGAPLSSTAPATVPDSAGSLEDEISLWVGPVAPVDAAERAAREFARLHPHLDDVFRIGERLVFSVRYGPIRAGQATMTIRGIEVVEGDSCYHIVTTAGSNDFFSTFFHVRDRVETFMRIRNLLPRRFEKHLLEGSYSNSEIVRFDHESQIALYGSGEDQQIAELWPASHDILSAFYDVRTRNLVPGEEIFLDSHAGRRNYGLKVMVQERERVKVPAGEFDCVVVEPMLRAPGLFKHEGALRVWLTDDGVRIPVQMKSALPIGSISVVLTEVTGRPDWMPQR